MITSIAAVATGIVVMVVAPSQPATFGWFAYAPLPDTTFSPVVNHIVSTATIIGLVILVAGLIGLAFSAGFIAGRRRAAEPS